MALTYSISGGADAAKFNINSATGVVTFKVAPDFEIPTDADANNVYLVQVKATDPGGLFDVQNLAVTVTDVAEGGGGAALPPLTASGSLTVAANNTTIQDKLITGSIQNDGYANLTVKNCWIKYPGGNGLRVANVTTGGLTVQDCRFEDTASASGSTYNSTDHICMNIDNVSGPLNITRVSFFGGVGARIQECNGFINMSFIEGHNIRGGNFPAGGAGGHFLELNYNRAGWLITDFSCINDNNNSWVDDVINGWLNTTTGSATMIFRRGLIDGQNTTIGSCMMFENTSNVLVEDVDALHFYNASFCQYYQSSQVGAGANMIYRRCRARDQVFTDLGHGPSSSGNTTWISSPGSVNTRFEQCSDWNVNYTHINGGDQLWDGTTVTLFDVTKVNFTPNAPIVNRTPGT